MISEINFILNSELINAELNPAIVLLDYIRSLRLTGTKEGCKEGDCGACTVIIGEIDENNELNYKSVNSCLLPVQNVNGKHVVTIEGLNLNEKFLNPIQQAFVDEGASQCGFCTPGFIVSMTSYFLNGSNRNFSNPAYSMDGNICRCTGHNSIVRAAGKIVEKFQHGNGKDYSIRYLSDNKIVPEYFHDIKERLINLKKEFAASISENGKKLFFIGSGTDLFVQRPDEMLSANGIFLGARNDMSSISIEKDECIIGASATVTDLLGSEVTNNIFPTIGNFAELFGSTPIRNCATIGGNINNASPIGDMTSMFMALDSTIILESGSGSRKVPMNRYFKSYKTVDRKINEYMKAISFKIPSGNYFINFEKVSKRTYLDIASVNSAILLKVNDKTILDVNISAGGVAAVPLCLSETSAFLKGKEIHPQILKEASAIALTEISPISDARGSRQYKQLLLTRLFFAHFVVLFPEFVNIEETT